MKAVLLALAGVIAGLLVASVLVFAVEIFSGLVHPPPEDFGGTHEEICRLVEQYPPWVLAVLVYPAFVLHARRLHDMGWTAWLLLAPGVLIAAAIWLHTHDAGAAAQSAVTWAAVAVAAGFALWGLVGKGQAVSSGLST